MKTRDFSLLEIRPKILSAKIIPSMSFEESFQNKTLRPILKMQNDLLISVFKNYIKKNKNRFYDIKIEERFKYIENAVQKDMKFRNSLKGIILGQFTLNEYNDYITNSSPINKRMMNLVTQRIQDQIQLLENT